MAHDIVTRFAPSPTGFLHIGGARTALFNWLFSKHAGGKMLLRIEDTDRARSTDEAIDAIFDGLNWLGLNADEDPVFQFSRADRHRQVVEELLAQGKAYKCYTSPEELAEMREKARAEGKSTLFRSPWRDVPESDHPEAPFVVRVKAPREGTTIIEDRVQGDVKIGNDQLDDMIVLRSDGTPVYMLAVVVDDHDMGVTHVIRGDDHLNNAARQMLVYDAMGWEVPQGRTAMAGFGTWDMTIGMLESEVGKGDFICGDRFTMADVYVGSQVDWGLSFGTMPERPAFVAYAERLRARDAYQASKAIDMALIAEAQG